MRVKLTKPGLEMAKLIEIPEFARVKFYSIFDDPNEYRVYYKDIQDFKDKIVDDCFGC